MQDIAKKLKILTNAVYYSHHRTVQTGSNQKRRRCGRPRCTTEIEDKYFRVSSLRNRRLTSPQLAASLNSTRKTPVSTSTVKRRLRDAGLAFLSKTRTFLSDPKVLNGSVHVRCESHSITLTLSHTLFHCLGGGVIVCYQCVSQ